MSTETRQRIGTARVNDILALLRGRAKDDAAIADDEVLFPQSGSRRCKLSHF